MGNYAGEANLGQRNLSPTVVLGYVRGEKRAESEQEGTSVEAKGTSQEGPCLSPS